MSISNYPPINGATIVVSQNGSTIATLTSDATGQAEVEIATQGTYNVAISASGFQTINFTVNIPMNNYNLAFRLNSQPKNNSLPTAMLAITLNATAAIASTVNESMLFTPNASNSTTVTEGMIENPTVTASPTNWYLFIEVGYGSSDLQQGIPSPNVGLNTIGSSSQVISGTTRQYCVYAYMYLDGVYVLDNASTTNELVNTVHSITASMPSLGIIRRAILFFRDAWELTASGTTTDGTFEVLVGYSKTFTNNLGSPPVCYYDYNLQGQIIGTHYATYQWYFDGASVGRGAGSYTVTAQTRGTSHTISCSWTCVGV